MSIRDWEFLIQSQVRKGRTIRVPDPVLETVGTDHLTKGPSIFWSIEDENRYVVLSRRPLSNEVYTNVGVFNVYDIDELKDGGGRIRPPSEIEDVWAADPRPGERVFFLTHEQMRYGEKPSVYLLSEAQVLDLLPNRAGEHTSAQRSLSDSIFRVPGFEDRR